MCCESADDEQLQYEPELFNCATCPVLQARQDLWPENLDAWFIFRTLASRLVVDAHLGPEVFRRLTEDRDTDAVADVLERLSLIHDAVMPAKTET